MKQRVKGSLASLVFATTALMVISSGSDVLAGALGSYSGAGRPSPIFDLGALDVVATGTNGHLYQWSRNKSTFGWTAYDLTNNVGGVTIQTSPDPGSSSTSEKAKALALGAVNNPQSCSTYVSNIGFSQRLCTGEIWCSAFATWVWANAGVSDRSGLNGYAGSYFIYGFNHGTFHSASSGYVPRPGDAVLYYNPNLGGVTTANATQNVYHVGIWVGTGSNGHNDVVNGNWGTPASVRYGYNDAGSSSSFALLGYVGIPTN